MLTLPPRGQETGRAYALRTLKENIIHLTLPPGSRVSENELAQQLGLSRTPVREALMELSRVGLVEVLPQRGSVISLVDYALVEEAQFLRETLECAVVERLCQTATPLPPALAENLELQAFYAKAGQGEPFFALDNAFHALLFDAARLPRLHGLMSAMAVHFDRVRAMSVKTLQAERNLGDHRLLAQAIAQGDSAQAKALMHIHLTRYQIDREAIQRAYPDYIKA